MTTHNTPDSKQEALNPIYVASRASIPERGEMWRGFRDQGIPITSSWIDEDGEGQTGDFDGLWLRITNEIRDASVLVIYALQSDFPLKGAFIEAGIALGMGKPVIVCLPDLGVLPRNYRPIGSWIAHPLVTRCDDINVAVRLATRSRASVAAVEGDAALVVDLQRELAYFFGQYHGTTNHRDDVLRCMENECVRIRKLLAAASSPLPAEPPPDDDPNHKHYNVPLTMSGEQAEVYYGLESQCPICKRQNGDPAPADPPRCPKCGYVMCQQFDSRPVNAIADIATPNGKYVCYYCTPIQPTGEQEQRFVSEVDQWKHDLTSAGWIAESSFQWQAPDGSLWRGPAGAWKELQRRQTNPHEQIARQIVGTVFHNTAASHETLKRVMIERITDYLTAAASPVTPSDAAMRAAEEIQDWNEHGEGTGNHAGDVAHIAAIITRHLAVPSRDFQKRLFDECVTANWDPERKNTFAEEVAHLHEELSEAFRAWRKYKDCEIRVVNGKLEGVPIEFADALIGMFYNAELHGFDLLAAIETKHQFNLTRNYVQEGRQLHATATTSPETRVEGEVRRHGTIEQLDGSVATFWPPLKCVCDHLEHKETGECVTCGLFCGPVSNAVAQEHLHAWSTAPVVDTGDDEGEDLTRLPRLPFICVKCNAQQHADGICANCGADALRTQPTAALRTQEGEGK